MRASEGQNRGAGVGPEEDPRPDVLAGKRILITGATGFLGQHLLRRLSASGAEIHAVSRTPRPATNGVRRWWECDCVDPEAVVRLLGAVHPDVTFHFAGAVTATPDLRVILSTYHSLLTSTVNLLTAVAHSERKGRVILLRSLDEPEGDGISVPSSPYAAAKQALTSYGRLFHVRYGVPVVFVRPFMTFGPGQNPRRVIPYTILSLLSGVPPKLGSANRRVDWIYVDDVVDGLFRAAHVPDLEGSTLELGSGSLVSVREIVERLVGRVNPAIAPILSSVRDRLSEVVRAAVPSEAYAASGWRPVTSLDEGLDLTVAWYRNAHASMPSTIAPPERS
jgi:UDP-glucose 4-epimerase